jgi:hypothetical protein
VLFAVAIFVVMSSDPPKPDKDGRFDAKQFAGIVLDDKAAVKTGEWTATTERKPYVGEGSLHDGGKNRGQARVRWTPTIPTAGRYRVKLVFAPSADLSTKTQIVMYTPIGATHITVNQRAPGKDGPAYLLGVFRIPAGKKSWLEVTNRGADGVVVADAVIFEPVPTSSSK